MEATKQTLRGAAAGPVHDALVNSANDLQSGPSLWGYDRKVTLAIVAGSCFLLGFLWAKSRAQL